MSKLYTLRSNRKKLGLIIGVLTIIIGVVPLLIFTYYPELKKSYTIEPLALRTEDGVYISAFKYTPEEEKSHAGIVVCHGFFGNKLTMQPLSIELAKRGFTVLNIDFRGHGASGGSFLRKNLIKDLKAAVDYFENELSYINEIGLVGHSIGAEIATSFSRSNPNKIKATVAIGGISPNFTGVSNLLLATGLFDPSLPEEKIIEILQIYTGNEDVNVGKAYYGDFNHGNNIKGYISPFSGHLSEIVDSAILYQVVQWFEQAFNGEKGNNIFITATFLQIFSYVALFGVIIIISILMVYLSNYFFKQKIEYPERDIFGEVSEYSITKLISYYAIYAVFIQFIVFLFLIDLLADVIPYSTVSITLSLIVGAAIGAFLIYIFILLGWEERFLFKHVPLKIKKMCSIHPGRSIIYGILIALLSILSIAAIWHWSVQNTLPTVREIGTMIIITLISFPFFLIREFYFRNVQGRLKTSYKYEEYFIMVGIGIFMDNFIIVSIIIIGRLNLAYLPGYALYLFVWVIFSIIQQLSVTWVYINSGRNILGSTIFLSIFYSWMLVVFFPSYGFL
ncbi:MAG: alpha/beta hydrolase family protein [Promethearchaeota archaeon]